MDLENKIKDLQEQLEFQKALKDVKVTFGRGNRYSKKIRDKIEGLVKTACENAAAGLPEGSSESLSEDDIAILKKIIASVKAKAEKGPETPKKASEKEAQNGLSNVVSKAIQNIANQNMAQVMLLDNVDRTLRGKVEPLSVVKVLGKRDQDTAFVETQKGIRFNIPVEDLDFNYAEQ